MVSCLIKLPINYFDPTNIMPTPCSSPWFTISPAQGSPVIPNGQKLMFSDSATNDMMPIKAPASRHTRLLAWLYLACIFPGSASSKTSVACSESFNCFL